MKKKKKNFGCLLLSTPLLIFLFILAISSVLSETTEKKPNQQPEANKGQEEIKSGKADKNEMEGANKISSKVTLQINVENKIIDNKLYIYGQTNLPNNTKLGVSVRNGQGYYAQDFNIRIEDGEFESTGFTKNKAQLDNGSYKITLISHFNEHWQSNPTLKQLSHYESAKIIKKGDHEALWIEKEIKINQDAKNFGRIKRELIGKKYEYPFSFKTIINKYGQPQTIREATTNKNWVAYFPKGDFTLMTVKSNDSIIRLFKGRKFIPE